MWFETKLILASVVAVPVAVYVLLSLSTPSFPPPPPSPPVDQELFGDENKVMMKLLAICRNRNFSPTAVVGIGRRGDAVARLISGVLRATNYKGDEVTATQYTPGFMQGPHGQKQRVLVVHHTSVPGDVVLAAFETIEEWGGDIIECVSFD